MNKLRFPRLTLTRAFAGALLFSATVFAISPDDLASLRAKAENGNGLAQYNLGLLYKDNRPDAPADPVEAYVWLSLAASNGATGTALPMISSQLTPRQLEEAQTRLERRRTELASKRSNPLTASRPLAAAEPVSPLSSATSEGPLSAPASPSPVLAAPEPTESAPPTLAEQKKLSAELAVAWKEIDQLKSQLGKAGQTTGTMDQLKRERDQLASTLATLTEETTKLRANAANFEGERNALQQKADAAAQQQKEALTAELTASNTKLKSAESELAQATASSHDATKQAVDQLTAQIQKLSTDNQRLTAEAQANGTAAEKLAASEKELSVLRGETGRLQTQLTEATAKATVAATTTSELASLRQTNSELTAQVQKLTSDNRQIVQQANQGTQQQKDALSAQITEAQAKLKDAEQAAAKANADRDALAQQLASAKSAAQAPSAEVTRLNAALTEAQSQLAASQAAASKANAERAQLAQQLATASAGADTVTAAQQQVSRLTTELNDSKSRLSASEEALSKANAERDRLSQQMAAVVPVRPGADEELAATKAKLQTAESALASAQAEGADLAKRLASASPNALPATTAVAASDDADLRKQLGESQLKLDSALRSYQLQQQEIDRLQKALTNIDAERAGLADRIQAATTQASVATAQAAVNNDANAQLGALREQLRQTQNQVASLAGENAQLRNRVALQGSNSAAALAAPTRPSVVQAQAQPSSGAAAAATRPSSTSAASPSVDAAISPDRIYTVAAGDTLSKISKKYYGSSEHWNEILDANRDVIHDPRSLTLGSKLKIP